MEFLKKYKWVFVYLIAFIAFVSALVFVCNISLVGAIGIAILASYVLALWFLIPALFDGLWS